MKYPKFINKGNTIGICAPSAGVGKYLQEYIDSVKFLKSQGFKVIETKSVRNNGLRSTSAKKRAEEFYKLTANKNVDMIMFATGGDYMYEIMPYVKYDEFIKRPIWLMGMSDPTNILFDVTIEHDIATLYGFNGKQYELCNPKWQKDNICILKGNLIKQKSYKKYRTSPDKWANINDFTHEVKWISKSDVDIQGRIIGGCFEVIKDHLVSQKENILKFIDKYKEDGIIWYFDIYSMDSLNFYLSLLTMKNAGMFKHTKGVLIGRVAIPNEDSNISYIQASDKALGKIPHILEMDIGHTEPCMTIINGSLAHVKYINNKGEISFKFK